MADDISSELVEKTGISYPQDYRLKTLNFVMASGKKMELKNLLKFHLLLILEAIIYLYF